VPPRARLPMIVTFPLSASTKSEELRLGKEELPSLRRSIPVSNGSPTAVSSDERWPRCQRELETMGRGLGCRTVRWDPKL
jgi:hypothetical protein